MQVTHVDGNQTHHIMLFALSTCGWCRRTKALLDELGLAYDYIFVDQVTPAESETVRNEVKKWNPACSYPTIVIDDKECIVGFQEDKIRSLAQS